ncbi:hypothetical protein N2152v2_008378 [Parachlorella kessleri]
MLATLPCHVRSLYLSSNAGRGRNARRSVVIRAGVVEQLLKPVTTSGAKKSLKEGIAELYDESSGLWENIEESIRFAKVAKVDKMVDVGCGIGGSSRYLARKFGCSSRGITLSPVQAQRAQQLTEEAGLADRVSFQVADALHQPFGDGEFDLVWSMESGEHMPEKPRFVNELVRVCTPGGRVIVVTWCHSESAPFVWLDGERRRRRQHSLRQGSVCKVLAPDEAELAADEKDLLDRICEAYYLPAWCSVADYERLFREQGLIDVRSDDWSEEVSPFWGEVIKSALTAEGIAGLLKAGWTTIKGALVMPLMAQGFQRGLVKVWAWRVHDQLSSSCLVFSLLCMFCVLIPAFLWHKYGLHWYCRRRTTIVVLLRLLLLGLAYAPTDCVASMLEPEAHEELAVLGHLMLPARAYTMLLTSLGFQLQPAQHLAVHGVALLAIMRRTPDLCRVHYFQDPHVTELLERMALRLGKLPLLTPLSLPPFKLPEPFAPCLALVTWIQVAWLFAFPTALIVMWGLKARREFALSQPARLISEAERARWLRVSDRLLYTLLLLYTPQAILALWHIIVPVVGLLCRRGWVS